MARSQLSTEVVILLAGLLIILMALISAFSNNPERGFLDRRSISARESCEKLSSGINNIYLAGDGAVQVLYIPPTLIDGTAYVLDIRASNRLADIKWLSRSVFTYYESQILTTSVAGNLTGIQGTVTIANSNGTISIRIS